MRYLDVDHVDNVDNVDNVGSVDNVGIVMRQSEAISDKGRQNLENNNHLLDLKHRFKIC